MPETRGSSLNDFERSFEQDRSQGSVRPLREYLAEHPGEETAVSKRFAELRGKGTRPATERVAHYQILEEIGAGGQGKVYLALDTRLGRLVALKMLVPGLLTEESMQRLRREAAITSKLDHHGICQVYEAEIQKDHAYIAMRYVDGKSLGEIIQAARREAETTDRKGCIAISDSGAEGSRSSTAAPSSGSHLNETREGIQRVVQLFEKIARAMQAAHSAGIVHRDIKPGNVMVGSDGEPVILDFGLARDLESAMSMTQTGAMLGTPAYMSPEQLAGHHIELDQRTDIYSLGASLYEVLTLHRPFDGPTVEGLYQAILGKDAPDPRDWNPAISNDLRLIIATAMEKDRDRRYRTAQDLADDLARCRKFEPIQARPISLTIRFSRWLRRHPYVAASVFTAFLCLSIGLAYSLWLLGRLEESYSNVERQNLELRARGLANATAEAMAEDPLRAVLLAREAVDTMATPETLSRLYGAVAALHEVRQLKEHSDVVREALFSPDGELVLSVGFDARAVLQDVDGRDPPRIALDHAEAILDAEFAPDGSRFATASRDRGIALREVESGALRHLLRGHRGAVNDIEFSPDGERLFSVSDDGTLRAWNLTSGAGQVLFSEPEARELTTLAVAADGSRIAVSTAGGGCVLLDAAGEALPLADFEGSAYRVFSGLPDCIAVCVGREDTDDRGSVVTPNDVLLFALEDGRLLRRLEGHGSTIESLAAAHVDGRWLLATGARDDTARIWPVDGGAETVIRSHGSYVTGVQFTADGRYLLTASRDTSARLFELSGREVMRLHGHQLKLNSAVAHPTRPLLLTASDDGTARLWRHYLPEIPAFRGHDGPVYSARFGADDQRIATASRDGTVALWNRQGELLRRFRAHGNQVYHCSFSPDGMRLVTASVDHSARIWNLRGDLVQELSRGGHTSVINTAFFSPDGSEVLTASDDGSARIWSTQSGEVVQLYVGREGEMVYASWAADGQRIVTAGKDGNAKVWSRDGSLLHTFDHKGVEVWSAVFSADGQHLLTAANDGIARLWPIPGGDPVQFVGHRSQIFVADLSPRGDRVVTASRDGTVRLWDSEGHELATLRGHRGLVWSAYFSADGSHILSAGHDRSARLWPVYQDELLQIADNHRLREFSEEELLRYADWLREGR